MYQLTPSVIALQRGMFYIDSRASESQKTPWMPTACTVQAELMQFGVMLDGRAFSCLSLLTDEDIIRYHDEVIARSTSRVSIRPTSRNIPS